MAPSNTHSRAVPILPARFFLAAVLAWMLTSGPAGAQVSAEGPAGSGSPIPGASAGPEAKPQPAAPPAPQAAPPAAEPAPAEPAGSSSEPQVESSPEEALKDSGSGGAPAAPPDVPAAPPVTASEQEASGAKPTEPAAAAAPEPAETAPVEKSAASEGVFQKMAKNLFGKKSEEGGSAGASEEDSPEAESQESQRKAKELVRLAVQNIEKKRITEAKKNINDLITLKPYEADYHFALGLCFRQEKRYKDALKKYQDVLDLGGPKSLVNLLRAEVAATEGEKDKVFEYLKEAAVGGRNIIHDVQNLPVLEKYKSDTEFIKLAMHLEKFDVQSKRTQDPFTNPFPASQQTGPTKPQAAPTGPVTLLPQDQQNLLADARRLFERIQWYIKLEDEDKAMENYIRLREILEKKDLLTLPKIVNDFRILLSRMDGLETQIEGIRLKYYWNQAQIRLKELKEAFHATEYAKVDSSYNEIDKLAKEMEKSSPRFRPVAERILAAARVWLNRSNVRREFQAAKPEIQGVVISEEAKLAIIDNRIIKQGERFKDFYIQKVENNRVTFRYKGEEIPLIFRRY